MVKSRTPPKRKLIEGQLTLKESFAIQRKKARLTRTIPQPYANPVHAFWTVPHLLRAVLSELPTREVVQLLTVDRSTLREGVAILYRHLDARDGLKGIGEANHGLGDDDDDAEFSFDGTQTQGTASQQANKAHRRHLVHAARLRQDLYRQSVHSIEVADSQDVERVFELLTTFPAVTSVYDIRRRLVMQPEPTFMVPVRLLTTDIHNRLTAETFPLDWGVKEVIALTMHGAPLYPTAAAMKVDSQPVVAALRAFTGIFCALHSVRLDVYVPHAELTVFIGRADTVKHLKALPDADDKDGLRGLIRGARGRLETLIIGPHRAFPSVFQLHEFFEHNSLLDIATFVRVDLAIAPPGRSIAQCLRRARHAIPFVKCRSIGVTVDDFHSPGVMPAMSVIATWA